MKKKIIIWGTSGQAKVVMDILRFDKQCEVIGFLDDRVSLRPSTFYGRPVFGGKEQLGRIAKIGTRRIILAFGDCPARLKLTHFLEENRFLLTGAIHPSAIIAKDAVVAPGAMISAGAIINPGCIVGKSVIINTNSSVDHGCRVGDAAHIGPGVCLGGDVEVGEAAWVGIGVTVKDNIRIGAGAIIGAGSVVVKDIPARVLAYGVPAKVIKK